MTRIDINKERLLHTLAEQGRMGWDDASGLHREACGAAFVQARDYLRAQMEAIGMATRVDSVGNVFGLLPGRDARAKTILCGSHLDSVPGGGIYDGAYGVFAALEVARSLAELGMPLRHGFEVVGFNAEEAGPLGGTFGSRAFAGLVETPPSPDVLAQNGLAPDCIALARDDMGRYRAFLEAHIEQGPVLHRKGIPIGVPTGIVGITRYFCRVRGEANHAGTTPMLERKDAFYEAIIMLNQWIGQMRQQTDAVCNIGSFRIEDGEAGVIPGSVAFVVELRSQEQERVQAAADSLETLLRSHPFCHITFEKIVGKPPVLLDGALMALVERASAALNLPCLVMPSGASHDANPMARVMPTAMLFVPSIDGVSHNKDENTSDEHLYDGVRVLAETVRLLDAQEA